LIILSIFSEQIPMFLPIFARLAAWLRLATPRREPNRDRPGKPCDDYDTAVSNSQGENTAF